MILIPDYELGFRGIKDIAKEYPSYAVAVRVDGGWMLFESYDEYRTWKAQK